MSRSVLISNQLISFLDLFNCSYHRSFLVTFWFYFCAVIIRLVSSLRLDGWSGYDGPREVGTSTIEQFSYLIEYRSIINRDIPHSRNATIHNRSPNSFTNRFWVIDQDKQLLRKNALFWGCTFFILGSMHLSELRRRHAPCVIAINVTNIIMNWWTIALLRLFIKLACARQETTATAPDCALFGGAIWKEFTSNTYSELAAMYLLKRVIGKKYVRN